MIILEGADSSGKTTLAQRLSVRYGGWEIKRGEGPPSSSTRLNERIEWYLNNLGERTICDRHPIISEQIYSFSFGRPWMSTIPSSVQINRLYREDPCIVYCKSPTGILTAQGSPSDTQEYIAALRERHHQILQQYEYYFKMNPPSAVWDWENYDVLTLVTDAHVRRLHDD